MTSMTPEWHPRRLAGEPGLVWHDVAVVADAPAETGGGAPVVLLHGVTRCGRDLEPLVQALMQAPATAGSADDADRARAPAGRLAVVDQRGHGDSDRADRYLVTDYAADAARFLADLGPATVVGHSLGAMVAAQVAAEHPTLVRGVLLIDPPFHAMAARIAGSSWEALFAGLRDAARRGGGVPALAAAIAEIRLPAGSTQVRLGDVRDAAALHWHAECLARLDPEVLTSVLEGRWLDGHDPAAIAAAIRCPVVLVQADPACGGALADADAAAFAAAAARCRVERVTGAGHALHRDHPERIAALARGLFDRGA
jgi:pimeloyl-ACP methyl ester carboxylesterase